MFAGWEYSSWLPKEGGACLIPLSASIHPVLYWGTHALTFPFTCGLNAESFSQVGIFIGLLSYVGLRV